VFQNFLLIGNGTLLHNVLCGRLGRYPWWRTLAGFPRTDRVEAFNILARLGLEGHVHRRAFEVSGGEQQRAALARALFQEPEMFLADEPVSNLDSELTGRVLEILRTQTRRVSHGSLRAPRPGTRGALRRFGDHSESRPAAKWAIREPGQNDDSAAVRR
jgi:ABC-type phosphate/phosphonate transport system ATPase subunit